MRSIQRHLTTRLLAGVLVLAGAAGAAIFFYTRSRLMVQFDRSLVSSAHAISALVILEGDGKIEFNPAAVNGAEFERSHHHRSYYEIRKADGTLLARSDGLSDDRLSRIPLPASGVAFADVELPGGRSGRAVALRFTPHPDADDEPPAKGHADAPAVAPQRLTLVVADDRGPIDSSLRVLASSLMVSGVLLSVVIALVVPLTVKAGLRPLRRLAGEVDSIEPASLHQRFTSTDVPRELQPICRGLDGLLARLDEAFARERRFTADAAHELRTPIAGLKALAEVGLKWPEDASVVQTCRETLDIANHMESLVAALLSLARFEARAQPVQSSTIDLCQAVRDVCRSHEKAATSRGLTIRLDLPPSAILKSDRTMLMPLLANLISNSVAYAPQATQIDCGVADGDDAYEFWVCNACLDLRPEDLPHLCEAFWRKDPARSGRLHVGLGLSLVSAYAAMLDATLKIELEDPHRFRASLRFRKNPSHPASVQPAKNAIPCVQSV